MNENDFQPDTDAQYEKKEEAMNEMFEKIQKISPIQPREIFYLMQFIFCISERSLLSHEDAFSCLSALLEIIYKHFDEKKGSQ